MYNNKVLPVNRIALLLITTVLLTACNNKSIPENNLESGFLDPAIENRPMAMWPWLNGFVDTTKLVYELEEMKNKGMRGVFLWDVGAIADPDKMIPAGPAYLGPESLNYISIAIKTGKRLGLDLGLMTSSSWNAGGAWVDKPEGSMQLLSTSQVISGPTRATITIGIPQDKSGEVKNCSLINSIAVPYNNTMEIDYSEDKIIQLNEFTAETAQPRW